MRVVRLPPVSPSTPVLGVPCPSCSVAARVPCTGLTQVHAARASLLAARRGREAGAVIAVHADGSHAAYVWGDAETDAERARRREWIDALVTRTAGRVA